MAKAPDDRLRQALRDNLKRRKTQTRGRAAGDDGRGKNATSGEERPPDDANGSERGDS